MLPSCRISMQSVPFPGSFMASVRLFLRAGSLRSLILVLGIGMGAMNAHAQTTYTVTNLSQSNAVVGSLQYAVDQVNAGSGGDTIVFASGLSGTITIGLYGPLTLSENVTITGPGANLLTLSGGGVSEIFDISSPGVTATISGLTIANGGFSGATGTQFGGGGMLEGGGIYNAGTLTVSNCTFYNDQSGDYIKDGPTGIDGFGGAIFNTGTMTVSNSTLYDNYAQNGVGGAIGNYHGTMTVINSTLTGNRAGLPCQGTGSCGTNGSGGAIQNQYAAKLTVINSTISGNNADDTQGTGIYNDTYGSASTVTLINSIVAGNLDTYLPGDDCDGCGTQSANNLISTPSNIINPMLGPLQYNGGPTETMMPLPGSPALNAGLSSTFSTDQRGFPRPTGTGVASDLGSVQVDPLTVTTAVDSVNTGTTCVGGDACSLRDAITLANSQGSGDILFATGVTGTITLGSALPDIATSTNITGPGANLLTVSGNKLYTVLVINSGVTANISGLTIANGNSVGNGGGIVNNGTLAVSNSTISGNAVSIGSIGSGYGGGIYNDGALTVSNSTFSGNTASDGGGGIFNNGGTLTVSNSTLSGNTASYEGGGIYIFGGTVTISNSTLSGNIGPVGGIYVSGGNLILTNSIVAGNTDTVTPGDDCGVCGTQSANNLISAAGSPLTAAQVLLGPLAYNGANQTVQTLLPLPGSPAIEAGLNSTLTKDQRGLPRPTGTGAVSDLGSVETNYTAVQFVQQPSNTLVDATITPAVALSVIESGAAAVNIPVSLTLNGSGTLGGTTTETTLAPQGGGVATASYGTLTVSAAGTGDILDVSLPITPTTAKTPLTLTASSSSFDVSQITPTITFNPPATEVFGTAPITLSATLSVTGPTISFKVNSGPGTISGNTLSFTGAGTVVVEAMSSDTAAYAPATAIADIIVSPAPTTTTLTASPTIVRPKGSVTLTAMVMAGTTPVPSGIVNFFNGTTSIGAASLNSSGVASMTTTSLPLGTDSVTASFVASANYTASTSAAVTVTVGHGGIGRPHK